MYCGCVVQTSCCTNNCSKVTEEDSRVEEYEVSSDSESEEEEMDNVSTKTLIR